MRLQEDPLTRCCASYGIVGVAERQAWQVTRVLCGLNIQPPRDN